MILLSQIIYINKENFVLDTHMLFRIWSCTYVLAVLSFELTHQIKRCRLATSLMYNTFNCIICQPETIRRLIQSKGLKKYDLGDIDVVYFIAACLISLQKEMNCTNWV